MKQLLSLLLFVFGTVCLSQETKESSFLSRNQPVDLFTDFKSLEIKKTPFQLKLPSESEREAKPYLSGFMNFASNDTRLLNYPPADLSDVNDMVFGSYMNTSFNLGNSTFNTIYIFDQSGTLVNTTASFSFGKKKK